MRHLPFRVVTPSQDDSALAASFDMSSSQPNMRFNTVVKTKGMRLVAEARGIET